MRRHARALARLSLFAALWLLVALFAHGVYHLADSALALRVPSAAVRVILFSALLTGVARALWSILARGSAPGLRGSVTLWLWITLILVGHALLQRDVPALEAELRALQASAGLPALFMTAIVYSLLLAVPFVPGMEIGLLIMLLFGPAGAAVAWIATVGGLALSFTVGRLLPQGILHTLVARVGLADPLDSDEPVAPFLGTRLGGLTRLPASHPYLILAVALNLPGNSVVGGGGGIALIAGASRHLSPGRFLLTVALATLPIPLLVALGYLSANRLVK